MQEFVYNQFVTIFGSGLIEKTSDFINIVVGALNTLFPLNGNGIMNTACTLFSGLAGSLLIIYYFLDMYSLAAKDLVSLEKLTISFIKLILCFMLVLYAKEITVNLFNLCGNMYHMVAEETINKEISQNGTSTDENNKKTDNGSLSKNITFWGMKSLPGYDDPIDVTITTTTTTSVGQATGNTTTNTETKTTKAKSMREVFQGKENSLFGSGAIKGPINAIGSVLTLMIPWMISYLAVALSYLISISNAILLIAYGFCMPLALAQCFEEGQRSAGIRYLKKFAAQALTFMVIIIILFAVSKLQGAILPQLLKGLCKNGTLDINNDNFRQVIGNWRVLISIVVVQFAAVGAMLKGAQIANDIVGV